MIIFSQIRTKYKIHKGFTLIELMVTIAIVTLVTGLVMFQYSAFDSSVLLRSQAYIMAFDLRETQSLAISVRANGVEASDREEYGMYFSTDSPNTYTLFQDVGTNEAVKYGGTDVKLSEYVIDPRFVIIQLCGVVGSGTCVELENLSISFARPDFDAKLYGSSSGSYTSAEITIGPGGDSAVTKKIIITSAGQISVE